MLCPTFLLGLLQEDCWMDFNSLLQTVALGRVFNFICFTLVSGRGTLNMPTYSIECWVGQKDGVIPPKLNH